MRPSQRTASATSVPLSRASYARDLSFALATVRFTASRHPVFATEHYVAPWIISLIDGVLVRDKSALVALQRAAVAIERGDSLHGFLAQHYLAVPPPHLIDRWLSEPNSAKTALVDAVCIERPATSACDLVQRCLLLQATQLYLATTNAIFAVSLV